MQMLFQGDSRQAGTPTKYAVSSGPPSPTWTTRPAASREDLHHIATSRTAEIDALIEQHSQNWRLERMPVVDRNLLRTGIAEMLGFPNTPAAIVINESLEVARRYAAPGIDPLP